MTVWKAVSEMQVSFHYDHTTISFTDIYNVYAHIIYNVICLLKYFDVKQAQNSASGTEQ